MSDKKLPSGKRRHINSFVKRNFTLQFIRLYHSLPALWNWQSKDYTNRVKKNEQYNILLQKYREQYPDADKQQVINRINSLRTNFRKELKRIRDWEQNGDLEDAEPKLWYYQEMKFLEDHKMASASEDSTMDVTSNDHVSPLDFLENPASSSTSIPIDQIYNSPKYDTSDHVSSADFPASTPVSTPIIDNVYSYPAKCSQTSTKNAKTQSSLNIQRKRLMLKRIELLNHKTILEIALLEKQLGVPSSVYTANVVNPPLNNYLNSFVQHQLNSDIIIKQENDI